MGLLYLYLGIVFTAHGFAVVSMTMLRNVDVDNESPVNSCLRANNDNSVSEVTVV
jgi:hypothetical protein